MTERLRFLPQPKKEKREGGKGIMVCLCLVPKRSSNVISPSENREKTAAEKEKRRRRGEEIEKEEGDEEE